MLTSLFVESNENLGLLYNRYRTIIGELESFMGVVETAIKSMAKDGFEHEDKINVKDKLDKFKASIEKDFNNPEPINVSDIKETISKVKGIKERSLDVVDRLARARQKYRFGNNWIDGILIKPKIYTQTINEKDHMKVNEYMRSVGRSLDWIEKISLELMNLVDQDLNLLLLVKKVYWHTLYEQVSLSLDEGDMFNEYMEDADNDQQNSYLSTPDVEPEEDDEEPKEDDEKRKLKDETDNIMDMQLNSDEEYVPIFSIIASYDLDRYQTDTDENQDALILRGKAIGKITLGENYTHTLISFDTGLEHMWHFMGDGFQPDNIMTNTAFEATKSIYINATFVTKDEAKIIFDEVRLYRETADQTKYSLATILNIMLGKPGHQDRRMMCSTFVGYLLSLGNSKNINRDYSMIRPEDITILPRAFYVTTFRDRADFVARRSEFDARVKKLYDENIDEIRDYNNELPKVMLTSKLKELGTMDKLFDWLGKKMNITA